MIVLPKGSRISRRNPDGTWTAFEETDHDINLRDPDDGPAQHD